MGTNAKRGGGDLAQQIKSLEGRMDPKQVATAKDLATKYPGDVIRYAVKLVSMNKPSNGGLTKRQAAEFDRITSTCGAEAAAKWKTAVLAEKSKASKAK